jgi:hypothetical protein
MARVRSGLLTLLCFFAFAASAHAQKPEVSATWPVDNTDTTAHLNFTITPHGQATSYVINWSTPGGPSGQLAGGDAGAGDAPVAFDRPLDGLRPGGIYDYVIVATNASGSASTAVTVVTRRQVQGGAGGVTTLTDNGSAAACPSEATVDWGDGSAPDRGATFTCLEVPGGQFFFTLTAHHAYAAEGHFPIVVAYPASPESRLYALIGPTVPAPPPLSQNVIVDPGLPTPAYGRTLVVAAAEGSGVRLRLPGQKAFAPLKTFAAVPIGTEVDATAGEVTLIAAPKAGGATQALKLSRGRFIATQTSGYATLRLSAPGSCKTRRALWAEGKGHFRVQGRAAYATPRGAARFVVQDGCAATLIRVVSGAVSVPKKKALLTVRAGRSYRARR